MGILLLGGQAPGISLPVLTFRQCMFVALYNSIQILSGKFIQVPQHCQCGN